MGIGRLSKRRRGRGKFKSPSTRRVATASLASPGNSFLGILTAYAVFHYRSGKLLVRIMAASTPSNYGPGIFIREVVDWDSSRNSTGEARKFLEGRLETLRQKIAARKLPPTRSRLDDCKKTSGGSPPCTTCTCWYCIDKDRA